MCVHSRKNWPHEIDFSRYEDNLIEPLGRQPTKPPGNVIRYVLRDAKHKCLTYESNADKQNGKRERAGQPAWACYRCQKNPHLVVAFAVYTAAGTGCVAAAAAASAAGATAAAAAGCVAGWAGNRTEQSVASTAFSDKK